MADLKEALLPHMCYRVKFGPPVLKDVGINTEDTKNWGTLELRSHGMGGVAEPDPKTHAPLRHVLPRQIWQLCDKGLGSAGAPPCWNGGVDDPLKQAHSLYVLPRQIR